MKVIFEIKHYTLKEVADILGLSTTSIHNYVKNGTLKACKLGMYWYVTEETIKDFLNNGGTAKKKSNE